MYKKLSDSQTFEIDGSDIEFNYTYELGEPETRDHPGSSTNIDIKSAMVVLPDHLGNMVKVDVFGLLDIEVDYDLITETIIENINESHNNPPEDD